MLAAGTAAGHHGAFHRQSRFAQNADMAAMLETHPFEQGPQHVTFAVPSREAVKTTTKFRAQPRAENERMEERIVGAG